MYKQLFEDHGPVIAGLIGAVSIVLAGIAGWYAGSMSSKDTYCSKAGELVVFNTDENWYANAYDIDALRADQLVRVTCDTPGKLLK